MKTGKKIDFGYLSFKWKVLLIIMLACFVTALASSGMFLYYEQMMFRESVKKEFASLLDSLAFKARFAIAQGDSDLMLRTLSELRSEESIVAAGVFGEEGALLASYERPGSGEYPLAVPRASGFDHEFLVEFVPVRDGGGEHLGTVYLKANIAERFEGRVEYSKGIVAGVMMLSSLVAFLVALRLQKIVSGPIVHLSGIAEKVSKDKDYSLRADDSRADEVGKLMKSFNEMLENIEIRERELREARAQTEEINHTLEETAPAAIATEISTSSSANPQVLDVMSVRNFTPCLRRLCIFPSARHALLSDFLSQIDNPRRRRSVVIRYNLKLATATRNTARQLRLQVQHSVSVVTVCLFFAIFDRLGVRWLDIDSPHIGHT